MVKRAALTALCVILCCLTGAPAFAEHGVTYKEGVAYFPREEEWTYRFEYSYPVLSAGDDDVAAMMVNETMETMMREMLELVLPMFSHSDDMTGGGQVVIRQTYEVTANTDRIFSVLMTKREKRGEEEYVTLEGTTFDVGGEYPGEMLTLRGVVRVGESSVQLGEALMPVLYQEYLALVDAGAAEEPLDAAEFYDTVAPTMDFYADNDENAVFYFQPSLFTEEYKGPHTLVFTPAQLEALADAMPSEE